MVQRTKKKPQADPVKTSTGVPKGDMDRFLSLSHGDPHSILGIHAEKKGVRIRVFRPDAQSVSILLNGKGGEVELSCSHSAGLFEVLLENLKELSPYRVKVGYSGNKVFTYWDPYAFWPTLGEMDLYL